MENKKSENNQLNSLTNNIEKNRALMMLRSALGEILSYFDNPDVVEIYVNSDQYLWVELQGKGRMQTTLKVSEESVRKIIEMVATISNTIANADKPLISAELPFYLYRFEGSLPPVTMKPSFNIRKPAMKIFTLDDYVNDGIITNRQKEIIIEAVRAKKNILIVGGTGSGKTTLTNAILDEISNTGDRIIILEDTRELVCSAKDYEAFRTQDNVSMNDLLKTTMRRRPDRIVVGEVRDKAALDLLKAWNTGHPGGVCTVHANSASGGLLRLEQLIQEAIPNPQQILIGEAVSLIIYISRTAVEVDGKVVAGRKVQEICRCEGYKHDEYVLEYIE